MPVGHLLSARGILEPKCQAYFTTCDYQYLEQSGSKNCKSQDLSISNYVTILQKE